MSARLDGRTALVTGSTDGIGAAIARTLADHGAHVVVTGRDADRGKQVVVDIVEAGGRADFVRADLTDATDVRALADAAHEIAGGPLDVLVNNAAMLIAPGPTADVAEDVVDLALAVNVKATFLLTGLVAARMVERGGGAVVNLGSINALAGLQGSALYSATKAALHSFTRSWAVEYGPSGVRVNTVAPGPTLTERLAPIAGQLGHLTDRMPSGRWSTPEEVAKSVLFLAGGDAANVHGAVLSVDGGYVAA